MFPVFGESNSAPHPFLLQLVTKRRMMWPSKAAKRAGESGSPRLIPDVTEIVFDDLP